MAPRSYWVLPPPETAEGSALLEAFLVASPFVRAPVANQSGPALGKRLQFQAFPAASAYMLILLRGVYIPPRYIDDFKRKPLVFIQNHRNINDF